MNTKVLVVTPEMALKWLEANNRNRKLSNTRVKKYAREMRSGRWTLTHQGVAFDSEGNILDGQHRLWAIAEAGIPIEMNTTFNVPTQARLAVDVGSTRSAADVLMLVGGFGEVGKDHIAVLRALFKFGPNSTRDKRDISAAEMAELLPKHMPAIQFSVDNLSKSKGGFLSAPIRAVVARAWYCLPDTSRLERFCQVLLSGLSVSDDEQPIILLRDFLSSVAAHNTSGARYIKYAKTERALRAYLDGQKITRLHAANGELFLLPDETEAA